MSKKLTDIIEKGGIFESPQIIEEYSKDNSFSRSIKPTHVLKVNRTEEIQKIVQWANETRTPLIPVSSGPPHFKGDTVPSVPEAVVVDLSNMNNILGINRQHRMVYIEPGVTYGAVQQALAKEGMTLSTCLAPRSSKSVMASVLEIEPRLNPRHQWSYMDPLRCMGVIWGDGNKMFTGEAGMGPPDLQKQWEVEKRQVSPGGPGQFDFFRLLTAAQGTMGIVTWASLKCELLPQVHKLYFVTSKVIDPLINMVYRILKLRFADELLLLSNSYLAYLIGDTKDRIDELKAQLPPWIVLIGIAGRTMLPQERVAAQEEDISEIAQQFGLHITPSLDGISGMEALKKIITPSPEPYWKMRYKGSFEDVFFITTLDKTRIFIDIMEKLSREYGYSAADIGIYIQPQHAGTSCHCEFNLPYDASNKQEASRLQDFYSIASRELSHSGAFYSRPYGVWSKIQFNKDAQTTITLKKLKDIFDPNGIMNPGKLCNY
ncbi:MAG: FAD-binding oxidoreductase [Deltaproteobacteria bacterium]|nr:FAD-binding oxidoreductase [Deltaproteobacteria bacterium]